MPGRRKILLIDHEPASSYMITMLLKLNDFDVDPYFEPESALSNFRKDLYDLILINMDIPAISGFELYKEMRKIDDKAKVCFIADQRARYADEFTALFPDFPSGRLAEMPVTSEELLKIIGLNIADND
jgi:DNA-binding response OmpR family regulator